MFEGPTHSRSESARKPHHTEAIHREAQEPHPPHESARQAQPDSNFDKALLGAASRGNAEEAKSLLAKGADADIRGDFDVTPLMYASQSGSVETVRVLLDSGADVNAKANARGTALLWAIEPGHVDVVKLLLERGADPNVKEQETGRTALMWAQERGHGEITALLEQSDAHHPESADGVASSRESLAIRKQLFSDIAIRQVSFRDSLIERAGNVAAATSMNVKHHFITGYPDTPADGAAFFSTFEGATCLFGLGDYGDEIFQAVSEAVSRRLAALRVETHSYPTYPVLQFVAWIHSSGFFRETLADIRDGNIMDFVSDLCATRSWKLIFCRYDPNEERRRGGLVDPVSATLDIRDSIVEIIKKEVLKARDVYLQLPSEKRDFAAASQRFMAANVPIGEMPSN